MSRTQPITSQAVELAMDLKERFHSLANADGVITADEEYVAMLIDRVLLKTERIDRSRIIARNIEDHGGITDYATRMDRELDRDLGPNVIHLDDYRQQPQDIA